jgi:thioredoxin 1
MAIKVATDATFEAEVLHNDRPVVVDFWAAWCGPCKLVAPEMEKLAAKYEGSIDIVKVDVDANPGLSRAFNIMSIPTIAFFAPGKQPMGVVGFRPAEQLETQFNLASFPKVETASVGDGADGATSAEAPVAPASTAGNGTAPGSATSATNGATEPQSEKATSDAA